MSVVKFQSRDTLPPEEDEVREDLLSLANKLDAFAPLSPWPFWIRSYSEMLRRLSREICEKE